MAKVRSVVFTVRGNCNFPHDMLRYDQCWPSDTESAVSAGRGIMDGRDEWITPRSVTLSTNNVHAPTSDRWKSFGWFVVDVRSKY